MNSQEFCYWLRGYFEVTGDNVNVALTEEQVKIIKDHLSLVFKKVTPTYCGTLAGKSDDSIVGFNLLTNHTGLSSAKLC